MKQTYDCFSRMSPCDKFIKILGYSIVIVMVVFTAYPFIYVFSNSISDPLAVMQNRVTFLPVSLNFEAYKKVIEYKQIWIGYRNTIFYTLFGTTCNMIATVLMAYPLSKKGLPGKNIVLLGCVFTMIFDPGLIPRYLVVKNLHLLDTIWALILPSLITTTNLMIMKTFFQNIPESLVDAAYMDGASEMQVLCKIVIPLSKPALTSLSLFYAVKHWNAYFDALLFLSKENLYPVQIFLRNIILESQTLDIIGETGADLEHLFMTESIKYATIVLVSAPIIIIYPFIQKYFKKGVMIGAIKG